jgi:carbonic anhydrase
MKTLTCNADEYSMRQNSRTVRLPSRCLLTAVVILGQSLLPHAWSQATTVPPAPAIAAPAASGTLTGEQALQRLLDGNDRFVSGKSMHPNQTTDRRAAVAGGQSPFAIVLACSDSRVAPELIFDQGLGDLFVIRNAGNVLDDHVLGSMEYAVEHLHVPLIIVVGHSKCGAVTAAVAGGEVPGHLHSVTDSIAPAVEQSKNLPGDKVDNAIRANAERAAEILAHTEPVLKEAVAHNNLLIVPARYDLDTGKIELLK